MPIASCLLYLFPIESLGSYCTLKSNFKLLYISNAFSGRLSFAFNGNIAAFTGEISKGIFKTTLCEPPSKFSFLNEAVIIARNNLSKPIEVSTTYGTKLLPVF